MVVATLLLLAGWARLEQVRVAPGASIEVRVPAPPLPVVVDGRTVLAYELHITNLRTVAVTVTRVDVIANGPPSPLATYQGADLRAALGPVGVRPGSPD